MCKEKLPALIITAGGTSSRFGRNKLLEKINGKEIILYTLEAFKNIKLSTTIITVSDELRENIKNIIPKNIKLVQGGNTRQQSVFNGLKALDNDTELVIIHDGARPLIKQHAIEQCIKKAKETKAAIVAVKAIDTIKITAPDGLIISTPQRDTLRCAQTPQIFDYNLILNAHTKLQGKNFSDDAGLLESLNIPVYTVDGEYSNIKITTQSDIQLIENALN